MRFVCLAAALVLPAAAPAAAASAAHVTAIDRMMAALVPESFRSAGTIKRIYREHLELLLLHEYGDLEGALATGGVALLPDDPLRFNLVPRLDGPHPIGEKDLENQLQYIAARPAAIGALLEIASRVRSGPIEITSLVRHSEYQDELSATNGNASTAVPMHAMGLAFDIALINSPLETVYEVRNVLREMQAAGDILFIGERQQLVFHVVPHPLRLGYFTDVYHEKLGSPPATQAAVVMADLPDIVIHEGTPNVVTDVVSVLPDDERLREEWLAAIRAGESPAPVPSRVESGPDLALGPAAAMWSVLTLLAGLASAVYRLVLTAP